MGDVHRFLAKWKDEVKTFVLEAQYAEMTPNDYPEDFELETQYCDCGSFFNGSVHRKHCKLCDDEFAHWVYVFESIIHTVIGKPLDLLLDLVGFTKLGERISAWTTPKNIWRRPK